MKSYKEQMDGLRFSPEQKRQMVEDLLSARSGAPRPRRRGGRMLAVGLAAALVLAVGAAGASGALPTASEVLGGIFGGSPAQTEVIDAIGRPIGASDTDAGVTITADAIIGDSTSYAVVYSIAREDGQPLFDPEEVEDVEGRLMLAFGEAETDVGVMGGAHGGAWFYDADPADGAVQYVETMTYDQEIRPGTARASFRDLCRYTEDMRRETLAEGKWDISFDFAFEDCSVRWEGEKAMDLGGGVQAVLTGATLSPLSFQVDYTVEGGIPFDGESGRYDQEAVDRCFHDVPVVLTLTDGTELDLTHSGGGFTPGDGETVCRKSGVFSPLLDLEEVESLTVGEVTIPASDLR